MRGSAKTFAGPRRLVGPLSGPRRLVGPPSGPRGRVFGLVHKWDHSLASKVQSLSDAALRFPLARAVREFDKLSKAEQEELCARDNCEPDQFAMDPELFCEWVPNPDREAFVKRVVMMMYPQIPSDQLPPPPPDGLGRVDAPYFIKAVWSMVSAMFAHDFCGFNPVT
jgi:hypothetical protein